MGAFKGYCAFFYSNFFTGVDLFELFYYYYHLHDFSFGELWVHAFLNDRWWCVPQTRCFWKTHLSCLSKDIPTRQTDHVRSVSTSMRWHLMEVNVVNHIQAVPDKDVVTTKSRGQNILCMTPQLACLSWHIEVKRIPDMSFGREQLGINGK